MSRRGAEAEGLVVLLPGVVAAFGTAVQYLKLKPFKYFSSYIEQLRTVCNTCVVPIHTDQQLCNHLKNV